MASGFQNFLKGIGLVVNATSQSNTLGDMEVVGTELRFHDGNVNDIVITADQTQTLTNKTLSGNTASNLVNGSGTLNINSSGVITVPNGTDTLVGMGLVQTITNKTIDGSSNNLTNIANASLVNSSITINGTSISLGDSDTITANTTNTLTIGTGLTGGSFDGSAPVTITIDSTVATLTGTQTLINKTLTSPVINAITGAPATPFSITPDTNQGVTISTSGAANMLLSAAGTNTLSAGGNTTVSSTTGDIAINASAGFVNITGFDGITLDGGTGIIEVKTDIRPEVFYNSNLGSDARAFLTTYTAAIDAGGGGNPLSLQQNGTTVVSIDSGLKIRPAQFLVLEGSSLNNITLSNPDSGGSSYNIALPNTPPSANTALVYNGSAYVWGLVSGGYTSSIQTTLAASGTITTSASEKQQAIEVAGNGAAVTLSVTPFSSSPPDKGVIRLIGTSDTNTVTITNNDASGGCLLNGTITLARGDVIEFMYSSNLGRYVESFRNN